MIKKKKILFILPSLRIGGAEKIGLNIINRLDQQRYEIVLILFQKAGPLLEQLSSSITLQEIAVTNKIAKLCSLIKALRQHQPQIVFSIMAHANILTGMASLFYRKALFIGRETTVHSKLLEGKSFYKRKLTRFFYQYFVSRLTIIIAQSAFMKQELITYFQLDGAKIVVLPNPVDRPTALKNTVVEGSSIKRLLSVGRLHPLKRTALLLKILHRLDNSYQLTIVGDGPERKKIEETILDLDLTDRVKLTGSVLDPSSYYQESDVFMLASAYDSYPNVVLEAFAAGVRVVAFDVPGAISELLANPVRGTLVDNGDLAGYQTAIEMLSEESYSPTKVAATIQSQNWSEYIKKIEQIFTLKEP